TFTYRLGVASSSKWSPPRMPVLGQDFFHYSNEPLVPSKAAAGEDGYFAASVANTRSIAFGVTDGVGGWNDEGVDPSVFSHSLCKAMIGAAQAGINRPQAILQTAYDEVMADDAVVAGGSTASVAVADAKGCLETANLGDSGFIIFGPAKVMHYSDPQTHAFNTPYQMAKLPPHVRRQHAIFGGAKHFSETPAQAAVEQHRLSHGDIVVIGTDGVWDNLSAQDTLGVVTGVMEQHGFWNKAILNNTKIRESHEIHLPTVLATAVMRTAKTAGLDTRRNGPFAREFAKEITRKHPDERWKGGKPDDIAVVVAVAVEDD
ncbi:protein serine/threonine phosphatase 2C, partial [Piedraia hortae CBS 480.64]